MKVGSILLRGVPVLVAACAAPASLDTASSEDSAEGFEQTALGDGHARRLLRAEVFRDRAELLVPGGQASVRVKPVAGARAPVRAPEVWWRASGDAMEFGFDLSERPPGGGPVVVGFVVEGWVAQSAPGGGVWLDRSDGTRLLVAGPSAVDAGGRLVPIALEPLEGGFALRIDDASATWPIHVDPTVSMFTTPQWLVTGMAPDFGSAVAVGNVDAAGETYSDLLLGSGDAFDGQTREGAIRLYRGGAAGPSTTPDWIYWSNIENRTLGRAVALVDLDGDGRDDIVAGAPSCGRQVAYSDKPAEDNPPYANDSVVYAFRSLPEGGFAAPVIIDSSDRTDVVVNSDNDCFGRSVARVADLDGDGDEELLVGAPRGSDPVAAEGRVYLFRGAPNFFTDPSQRRWQWSVRGDRTLRQFGLSVADVGDLFDDGTSDLYVGTNHVDTERDGLLDQVFVYRVDTTGQIAASPTVFRRSDSGAAAADPNAARCDRRSGFSSIVAAGGGDITGDGIDDLLVGCQRFYDLPSEDGVGFLYPGSKDFGPPSAPTRRFRYGPGSGGGVSFAFVGDLDGDGVVELAAGTPLNGSNSSGGAAIWGSSPPDAQPDWDVVQPSGVPSQWGRAVFGGGDFNGDGRADLVLGGFLQMDSSTQPGAAGIYFGYTDADFDGYAYPVDCDDTSAGRNPGLPEVPGDGIDQDCNGKDRCYVDSDNDGVGISTLANSLTLDCVADVGLASVPGDCNDALAAVSPAVAEVVADGIDQDCDFVDSCYTDADDDNVGTSVVIDGSTLNCTTGIGAPVSGDCADEDPLRNPNGVEVVADGLDQDCDGVDACFLDADNDNHGVSTVVDGSSLDCATGSGAPAADDCDDSNAGRNPGLPETVADGIDQDCDLVDSCYEDLDGDGVGSAAVVDGVSLDCRADAQRAAETGDCDDGKAERHPGLAEIVGDGVDQDCDNVDRCYVDSDDDGFGTSTEIDGLTTSCVADAGRAAVDGDCDDSTSTVNPSRTEVIADGVDQNCDDKEACYLDADLDGYGVSTGVLRYSVDDDDCADDYESVRADDCDDDTRAVYPDADEVVANDRDENCDGREACYRDADGDGAAGSGTVLAADAACDDVGEFVTVSDCADDDAARYPGAFDLPYDGIDQDCSGVDSRDLDGDGASDPDDCDDTNAAVSPLRTEVPNGIDDDCDGLVDEGTVNADDDGDGYSEAGGDCNDADPDVYPMNAERGDSADQNCNETADEGTTRYDDDGDGLSENAGDCNDRDPGVYSGAAEVVNGRDEDCDGSVDEGTRASDDDGDGLSENEGDCDDANAEVSPIVTEVLGNAVDDDCDGRVDAPGDRDGDGRVGDQDCDEQDWSIHVGALEVCNDGIDQDCDGADGACDEAEVKVEREGGCSSSGSPSWLLGTLLALGATRRRR